MRIAAALLGIAVGTLTAPPARAAEGHRSDLVNRLSLRVCADPANMPFSNEKGEGFENKIAEIVAAELNVPIEYLWFPQATGFIRQTLFSKRCDVVMGYAQGDELVLNTNAYYRSAYTLVYRKGAGLDGVDHLADARLKDKRIGLIAGNGRLPFLFANAAREQGLRVVAVAHRGEADPALESEVAELFADKLKKKLDYVFFPQATGFVRMTLGAHRCDVIMGFPQGDDMVQGTNP